MALTITGGSSMYRLLANISRLETQRAVSMARLSTGKRINHAADDPSGMIALSSLNSDLTAVNAAIENGTRSRAMLDTAAGAMDEISSLISEVQRLAVASGGNTLSSSEIAANQSQIDAAIDSIDRLVGSTTYNGRGLIDGTNQIATSMNAAAAADLKDVRVYSRSPNSGSTSLSVNVATVAKRATTSGTVVANITSPLSAATAVSISGKEGTTVITLTSGSNIASILTQINAGKGETGVSATASGTQLKLTSVDYGSDAFVSITALSGDQDVMATANVGQISGTDAVVTVNGSSALVDGTEIHWSGNDLSFSTTLVDNTTGTRTITVTGGGASFQIGTDLNSKAVIGINGMYSSMLGRSGLGHLSDLKSGGSASLTSDPGAAALIAGKAAMQVATASSRLGGFIAYSLDATANSLSSRQENLSDAMSSIGDTDMAAETARLERHNLLANAALSMLDLLASHQRSILSLLN